MAKLEKLSAEFKLCRGPFPWKKFVRLLGALGYVRVTPSKTGGSRRAFYNEELNDIIKLDEPHDGEMGFGMVKRLQRRLVDKEIL